MTPLNDWIATYVLLVSALVLVLAMALLTGDLAWQHNARWHRKAIAEGRKPTIMRWHAGLLLVLAMGLLFAAVALAVNAAQPGELAGFDSALATSLSTHVAKPVLRMGAWVTQLGGTLVIAPCATLVAAGLAFRRRRQLAGIWVLTMLAIIPLNRALKAIFHRARPLYDHGCAVEHSWSFPSGHAFGSIIFYGMLAYVLLRVLPRSVDRAVIAATVLLVGSVGITRIMLQVHYFSDVVAGYASGAAWLLLCISLAEYLHVDSRGGPRALPSHAPDRS